MGPKWVGPFITPSERALYNRIHPKISNCQPPKGFTEENFFEGPANHRSFDEAALKLDLKIISATAAFSILDRYENDPLFYGEKVLTHVLNCRNCLAFMKRLRQSANGNGKHR